MTIQEVSNLGCGINNHMNQFEVWNFQVLEGEGGGNATTPKQRRVLSGNPDEEEAQGHLCFELGGEVCKWILKHSCRPWTVLHRKYSTGDDHSFINLDYPTFSTCFCPVSQWLLETSEQITALDHIQKKKTDDCPSGPGEVFFSPDWKKRWYPLSSRMIHVTSYIFSTEKPPFQPVLSVHPFLKSSVTQVKFKAL
ncbi:hypothetical protein H6P81_007716 [Aristolochia fimbriata]|uniref:Uncharacterized protein n=1 Tax=Aristolochia fimbriata TaxID=158543 RepID=A0AAV7F4D1_ARIFI|nr:hypothetical protein H6P81_007716 [Aristolochia fimbriata]